MAVSAPRTSDWVRTFLKTPRSGVGVTRGAVVATVTSGRDEMLGESMGAPARWGMTGPGPAPGMGPSRPERGQVACRAPISCSGAPVLPVQRDQAMRARRARLSVGAGPSSLK